MSLEIHDPTKEFSVNIGDAEFVVRHWTTDDQEVVDRECLVDEGNGKFKWNQSLDRSLKINRCVLGWSGITMSGEDFPFTEENKKKLPVGIKILIVKEIEERAGLRMTAKEKKT